MTSVLDRLVANGHRIGILSNTNAAHWAFANSGRFPLVRHAFEVHALSFELKCMKPDPAIYHAAADLAGVAPSALFVVDDRTDNVEGARAVGIDAVVYESAERLLEDLKVRDLLYRGVRSPPYYHFSGRSPLMIRRPDS